MNISLLFSTDEWFLIADLYRNSSGQLYWAVDMYNRAALEETGTTIQEMERLTGSTHKGAPPPLLVIPDEPRPFYVPYETIPL